MEIPESLIVDALTLELDAGAVIADTVENRVCVFLARLYRAEQSIAARLRTLNAGRRPWPAIDARKAIPWVEEKTGLTLAESQKEAVCTALAAKVMVITGGPGVGKTTLVNAILSWRPAFGRPCWMKVVRVKSPQNQCLIVHSLFSCNCQVVVSPKCHTPGTIDCGAAIL